MNSFCMPYHYSAGTEIITNNFLYNKKVQINICVSKSTAIPDFYGVHGTVVKTSNVPGLNV